MHTPEAEQEERMWREVFKIQLAAVSKQQDDLREQQERMQAALDLNTKATTDVRTNTSELVDILNSWKGAFKVFEFIGKLAKPLAAIVGVVAAIGALWASFKK